MKKFAINAAHVFMAAVGFAVCIEHVVCLVNNNRNKA